MPHQQRYINEAMNADETEQKILQLAKAIPADERVPSGFAMRLMSDIREIHTRETSQADEQFLRLARNIPANGMCRMPSRNASWLTCGRC